MAMYNAWWHKRVNVRCSARVKGDGEVFASKWSDMIDSRNQERLVILNGKERVPTLWSGIKFIALAGAMI